MCVSICFPFFLAHQEGRSPFIFKADEESNKKGRPNIDDISDTEAASDFTIRDTLSRSCSSLEEEQEKSLAELRALAMADASGFNPEQDDTLPMDSQPVEDDAGFHSKSLLLVRSSTWTVTSRTPQQLALRVLSRMPWWLCSGWWRPRSARMSSC